MWCFRRAAGKQKQEERTGQRGDGDNRGVRVRRQHSLRQLFISPKLLRVLLLVVTAQAMIKKNPGKNRLEFVF